MGKKMAENAAKRWNASFGLSNIKFIYNLRTNLNLRLNAALAVFVCVSARVCMLLSASLNERWMWVLTMKIGDYNKYNILCVKFFGLAFLLAFPFILALN